MYKKGSNWWKCYLIMTVKIKLKACRIDHLGLHSNFDWLKTQRGYIISCISSFLCRYHLRINIKQWDKTTLKRMLNIIIVWKNSIHFIMKILQIYRENKKNFKTFRHQRSLSSYVTSNMCQFYIYFYYSSFIEEDTLAIFSRSSSSSFLLSDFIIFFYEILCVSLSLWG